MGNLATANSAFQINSQSFVETVVFRLPSTTYTTGNALINLGINYVGSSTNTISGVRTDVVGGSSYMYIISPNIMTILKSCTCSISMFLNIYKYNPGTTIPMALFIKKNGLVIKTFLPITQPVTKYFPGQRMDPQITPNGTATTAMGCASACDSNINCIGWSYINNGTSNVCSYNNDLGSTGGGWMAGPVDTYTVYNSTLSASCILTLNAGDTISFVFSRACSIFGYQYYNTGGPGVSDSVIMLNFN
jgi:hypothetical protein